MSKFWSNLGRHPKGLYILFITEMAERFSFYTMSSLLVLYMTKHFGLSDAAAGQVYGIWGFFTWVSPLLGGSLADRRWGTIKAVTIGGIVFFFGHLLLGFTDFVPDKVEGASEFSSPAFWIFCLGLLTVAAGNGFFKGNISVLVGALYDREDLKDLRDDAFQIFYVGINLGAFLAPLSAPWIRNHFGWGIAFGSAAAGIVISFAVFLAGKHLLVDRTPTQLPTNSTDTALKNKPKIEPLTPKQKSQLKAIAFVLFCSALFWSVFFQEFYALTLFADQHTDRSGWGWDAENFLTINPAGIFLFSPLFVWIWQLLRRKNLEPSTPAKMGFGILSLGFAMAVMIYASSLIPESTNALVSPWFISAALVLLTIGELFLSPMGLSFVTKYAPPGRKGTLMGAWFGSLALGIYTTGALGSLGLSLVGFYTLLSVMMFVTAIILFLSLKKLKAALD